MEKSTAPQNSQEPESQDNKSDVKAIMARFQTGGQSVEGSPGSRPKPPLQPTLSSGPSVPAKKPILEGSLSGGASISPAPKPCFLKNAVNTAKSAPDVHDPPKPKALASRFENAQENNKVNFKVPFKPKPPDSTHDVEPKAPFPKVPLQKPPTNSMAHDSKTTSPKPMNPAAKPPWVKDTKAEDSSGSPYPTTPKLPSAPKPKSTVALIKEQQEASSNAGSAVQSSSVSNVKPSSFRVKNSFNKPEEGVKEGAKVPGAHETKPVKPTFPKKTAGPPTQIASDDPSAPKKKTLPNTYALGSAPAKPNRPPKVSLDKFKKVTEATAEGSAPKNAGPPPPPASHPSNQGDPIVPSQPNPPSLPPRPSGPLIQDENYDDVEFLRGSSGGQRNEGSGSDGEIYQDPDGSWSAAESSKPQKKHDKEQDIKSQKERERKEKEAMKRFKLTSPLQVIHQVKANADCKGGKSDLSIKKGELIDIIRITDNPEGKWLARSPDGSVGFIKTEAVEIDINVLKNLSANPVNEDVYDDVAAKDDHGNMNGQRVVLPPPLDDVYDDIPDSNFHPISIPPPAQFTPEGNKDNSPDEIYDDIDSLPVATPISSLPQTKLKATKGHDDPKKQKKFEKEEKEFRKKFKYDGEIQVLYQAMIVASKKGGGKELAVQAGETVDVISKSDPDKLICRNKEGKFGCVSTSNIQQDDEVYDDIGDDCIYDND